MAKYLKVLVCVVDPPLYPLFAEQVHPFTPNLVADAYFSALARVETGPIEKIQVTFVDRPEADGHASELIDVVEILKYLDSANYEQLDEIGKRLKLAELMHSAVLALCRAHGWDASPFEQAHAKIVATGVSLGGPLGKPATSPDKRWRAQLEYEYVRNIDVYIAVTDLEGNRRCRVLFAKLPGIFSVIAKTIGSMKWTSNDELEVRHQNKKDKWLVKLDEKPRSEFITERAARDDPHGLYDLGMNYANGYLVPKDLERARYWLERAAARGYNKAPSALARLGESPL